MHTLPWVCIIPYYNRFPLATPAKKGAKKSSAKTSSAKKKSAPKKAAAAKKSKAAPKPKPKPKAKKAGGQEEVLFFTSSWPRRSKEQNSPLPLLSVPHLTSLCSCT